MRANIEWNPHDGSFWCISIYKGNEIRLSRKEARELVKKLQEIEKSLSNE